MRNRHKICKRVEIGVLRIAATAAAAVSVIPPYMPLPVLLGIAVHAAQAASHTACATAAAAVHATVCCCARRRCCHSTCCCCCCCCSIYMPLSRHRCTCHHTAASLRMPMRTCCHARHCYRACTHATTAAHGAATSTAHVSCHCHHTHTPPPLCMCYWRACFRRRVCHDCCRHGYNCCVRGRSCGHILLRKAALPCVHQNQPFYLPFPPW